MITDPPEQAYQWVKTIEDYDERFQELKRSKSLPGFLVYGDSEVVRDAIDGQGTYYVRDEWILQSLQLSLQADRHSRFVILLEAVKERCSEVDAQRKMERTSPASEEFIAEFLRRFILPKNSMLIKRFFTIYGQEFKQRSPESFEAICRHFVHAVINQIDGNPAIEKLLIDFVGQSSLLTETVYAGAYLDAYTIFYDSARQEFIKRGWREAIGEGLKVEYMSGGRKLWIVITKMFPGQFPKDYPPSDAVREAALANFPSKREVEERWVEVNVVPFQKALMKKLDEAVERTLPSVLTRIVFEYANTGCTWIDIPETWR